MIKSWQNQDLPSLVPDIAVVGANIKHHATLRPRLELERDLQSLFQVYVVGLGGVAGHAAACEECATLVVVGAVHQLDTLQSLRQGRVTDLEVGHAAHKRVGDDESDLDGRQPVVNDV